MRVIVSSSPMPEHSRERRAVYPEDARSEPGTGRSPAGWGPGQTAILALVVALFLVHSYLPLRATDLWQHVTYGNWILDHGALPTEDPVMPLSAGVEVVDTEWLSQVLFALVERVAGPEGLSVLFALTTLLIYLVLGHVFYLQTRRRWVALAAALLALGVGFSRLMTIRPENFAVLAFATLLWLLVSSGAATDSESLRRPLRLWIGVPLLFAVWANLHGSFPAGLILLGCFLAGRTLECLWSARSLGAVLKDRAFRRWLLLTEVAFLSCLVNPYGARLVLDILSFSAHENLRDIVEWYSLDLSAWGGLEFFLSWALLVIVLRHSRRRVPVADALMIAVFAVMVVRGNRFLSWYAPAFAYVLAPHLADLAARVRPGGWRRIRIAAAVVDWQRIYLTRRVWIAASVLLAWVGFALSPMSRPVLGGGERAAEQVFGDQSPVALAAHLREQPTTGLVFVPQVWSDFLVRFGPAGFQPMVTSMIHLIPHDVWRDYMSVHNSVAGWTRVMEMYSIDTVILDQAAHRPQIGVLTRMDGWKLDYEDSQAVLFKRELYGAEDSMTAAPNGAGALDAVEAGE